MPANDNRAFLGLAPADKARRAESDLAARTVRFLGPEYAHDPNGLARFYHDQELQGGRTELTFEQWLPEWRQRVSETEEPA